MAAGDPVLEPGAVLASKTHTTMSGHGTFTQPTAIISIFFLNPDGANRNFNPSGTFTDGHIVIVKNTAAKGTTYYITVDSTGIAEKIYAGRSVQIVWDNTAGVWGKC